MSEGKICCPKCGSTQIDAQSRGFNALKATGAGLVGGLFFGPVGLIAGGALGGTADQNQIVLTCLECGHRFRPGQGSAQASDKPSNEGADSHPRPRKRSMDW